MRRDLLTRITELLEYDPSTGNLRWRVSRPGISAGPAGSIGGNGYVYITLDGKKLLAHRIAWLISHGEWPAQDVDHINGCKTDNRLSNLRAVSREVNNQNRRNVRSNNRAGATGVSWHEHSKCWRARIMVQGKETCLGHFTTVDEASAAYVQAKRRMHVGCTI